MSGAQAQAKVTSRITAFDPGPGETLAFYDKLYLQITYDSQIALRFQAVPLRKGVELEFGAMESSPSLYPAGQRDALVWVSFSNPTRIDGIEISILDSEWQEVDQLGIDFDVSWNAPMGEQPRKPAEWVGKLIRKERLKQELVFDPTPQKEETIFDLFFLASAMTIPFYLFLQIQFIRKFRGRWRELSAVPIISIAPMIVLSLFGLGLEFRLWVIFIFRGIPLALIYLIALWVAKRFSEDRDSLS